MANVDEYAVGKLKVGQQIPLTSKAHPDTVFHGKIVNISKSPDFATKKSTNELNDQDVVTYEVKIALSEKDDIMLYPGMLVQVDLDKAGEKNDSDIFQGASSGALASGERSAGHLYVSRCPASDEYCGLRCLPKRHCQPYSSGSGGNVVLRKKQES